MREGGAIGKHTFEQNLVELYSEGLITLEDAESAATSANDLRLLLMRGMGKSF
jgi:twitching motility protein PilT